ncbi:hypothetical protein BOX15_Mlig018643g3 [Macrostomum lignano]|uniref:Calponin-homology (CH) domain-containing protein n=2 Tax=Macrostomum lignano TaxID=282301 RepID=A0A1I8J3Z1_9PLAT|nr:hypothetical protein BOX15_Mlig018643g3 [Macrostomum lignano]
MPLFGRKSVEPERQRKRIYSEEEIKERLESMDPEMQNTFIRMAEMLMHKESQMFLDIVAKSRQDIREVGDSIKEEQDVLKTTAKVLARERGGAESLEYADIDEEDAQTKVHFESEYNKKVVQDYLKAVGRDVPNKTTEVQKRRNYRLKMQEGGAGASYVPEYARRVGSEASNFDQRPYTASSSGSRPGTAYRMRMSRPGEDEGASAMASASWQSTATPPQRERTMEEDAKVKEEKEELMEQMKMMDDMMQGEKARQQEALQARKEARKARKEKKKADEETQAMELMESNQEAEEQKRKNKERQEQILKERLAKKRLERRKTLQDIAAEEPAEAEGGSHVPAEERAQELERELGITRAKTSIVNEGEAASGAKETKKKGKKKQAAEDAAPPPPPVEANWDVTEDAAKKTTKKKKGKKAEAEAEVVEEAATQPGDDDGKKKKKKKKAAATPVEAPGADDTVLNLDVDGPSERKKKGKKKKLSEDLDLTVSEV